MSGSQRRTPLPPSLLAFCLAACLGLLPGSPLAAGDAAERGRDPEGWLVGQADGITLWSQVGEHGPQAVLAEVVVLRRVVAELLGGEEEDDPLPIRIFLFHDWDQWRRCSVSPPGEPETASGYCSRRRHGFYLAVAPAYRAGGGLEVARHEYAHQLLMRAIPEPPIWLNEGLAELLSNCALKDGGVEIGRPLDRHLEVLRRQGIMSLGWLLTLTRAEARQLGKVDLLYAEGWALVHLLVTGDQDLRDGFRRYLAALKAGRDAQEAWTEALEADDARLEAALRERIRSRRLPTVRRPVGELDGLQVEMVAARPADVHAALGDLQQQLPGRPRPEAEENFWRALDLDPGCAAAHLGLAGVAEAFARPDIADREQAAAVELAPGDPWLLARVGWQLLGRVGGRQGRQGGFADADEERTAAGEIGRARDLFGRALAIDAENPLARSGLVAIETAAGGPGEAPTEGSGAEPTDRPDDAPAEGADATAGGLSEEQRRLNLESFDTVWQTVRDKHWDPDLVGADWEAAREDLRPLVAQAGSMAEARAVMQRLLGRLGQSHFGIIPGSVYEAVQERRRTDEEEPGDEAGEEAEAEGAEADAGEADEGGGEPGSAGVEVRAVDGRALLTFVHPDGAAAGLLHEGWILTAVDGVAVDSLLQAVRDGVAGSAGDSALVGLYQAQAVGNLLEGDAGDVVRVQALAAGDDPVAVDLPLGEPPGRPAGLGNLPEQDVWLLRRRLPSGVGYVRFDFFLDPVRIMGGLQQAVADFRDAPGMIIDLRGNRGGLGAMAMGIAGWFVADRDLYLGTMHTRDMTLKFTVNPRPPHFDGPLAVLVDDLSLSTSEILAGGLQDLGRARILGTPTPGAALPSIIARLPNGDGFQYAFASYVRADGEPLEGRGVRPDAIVPPDRESLLRGVDPVVEAARRWILSRPEAAAPSGE